MKHMLDIRLTFLKKSGFFVLLVILGAFFCIDTPWAQERSQNPYSPFIGRWIGWEGWITISHDKELTQRFELAPGSAGSGESHYREEFHADEKIEVCCCPYNNIEPISNITMLEHYRDINSLSFFQYDKALCETRGRRHSDPPKVMQPGDSIRREIQHTENKAENEPHKRSVRFGLHPDGKYLLLVYTEYFVERISDQIETEEWVCKGGEKITKFEIRPRGLQERSTIYSTKQSPISHDLPLTPNLLAFDVDVTINGNLIEGEEKPISKRSAEPYYKQWRVHPTKFKEKVNNGHEKQVVKFKIKLKDGCSDVIELLMNEAAFLRAWKDPSLKEKAFEIEWKERKENLPNRRPLHKHYGDLVDDYARSLRDERRPPEDRPGGGDQSIDIGTDFAKCEIKNKKEFLQQQKKICQPNVLVDSILRHENTHVSQCEHYRDNNLDEYRMDPYFPLKNIHLLSKDEIEATCAGMKRLINWLEDRPWCNFDALIYRKMCEKPSR